MPQPAIARLPEHIAALPDPLPAICNRIYLVERLSGATDPPAAMHDWITASFGSVEQVRTQTIIKVTNRFTLEATAFNPLRARRPQEQHAAGDDSPDAHLEAAIAASLADNTMFRDPLNATTADVFGRIWGQFCVTASNVAKYDGWHGLVIFDEANPLVFDAPRLTDYFDVAVRWLLAAHAHDPAARYPLITWNCLWKSGASMTHGHLQMVLSKAMPAAHLEHRRRAEASYHSHYDSRLSDDVWQVHRGLGLSFAEHNHPFARICGYASLTPFKDREVVLQSDITRLDSDALQPLWHATCTTLRGLIDRQGVRSFNLAVALPPVGDVPHGDGDGDGDAWDNLTAQVRIVDRGDPLSRMVNIGAMELFANSVVATDPFDVAALLQ